MTKIFLVEDSPPVLARLRDLFAGVERVEVVGEAGSAHDAIAGILRTQPDVVLLDLDLTDSSGFDVLRALAARLPQVTFCMLSNHSAYPYRELAGRLGARAFLDKTREFEQARDLVAALAKTKGEPSCLQASC
jgi:DNA-binding NarL/FixJ family response regulator